MWFLISMRADMESAPTDDVGFPLSRRGGVSPPATCGFGFTKHMHIKTPAPNGAGEKRYLLFSFLVPRCFSSLLSILKNIVIILVITEFPLS